MKHTANRLLALVLALALALALSAAAFADGSAVLRYELTSDGKSSITVSTGDVVEVKFTIRRTDSDGAYQLNAMDNDVEYDKTFFEPVDVTVVKSGEGHPAAAFDQRLVKEQAIVRINDYTGSYAAEELICTFRLRVKATSGSTVIRSSECLAYDAAGTKLTVETQDLTVSFPAPPAPSGGDTETKPCDGGDNCPSRHLVDVDKTQWYHEAIDYVIVKSLMQGMSATTFEPNTPTTRGMIVTILHRLEGEPAAANTAEFTDVPENQWYAKAVAWAAENGIVLGFGDGSFGPMQTITREQFAAIMMRYCDYKGYDTAARADLSGYTDAGNISTWAVENMRWANAAGLITGRSETTLVPGGSATRAEAAQILMRFLRSLEG